MQMFDTRGADWRHMRSSFQTAWATLLATSAREDWGKRQRQKRRGAATSSKQADDESLSTQTQEESWIAKDGGATSGRGACEKRKNETNGRDSQNNGEKAKAKPGSKSNAADVTKKQETINKQEKEHLNTTLNKQFQVHTHSSLRKDEDTHTRRARAYY